MVINSKQGGGYYIWMYLEKRGFRDEMAFKASDREVDCRRITNLLQE